MSPFGSRIFAQARAALSADRPDLAEELIAEVRYDKPASATDILKEIARSYAIRGRRQLIAKNPDAAWQDLNAAEALNTGEPVVSELRDDLYRSGLAECRSSLDHGDPFRVLGLVQALRDRRCAHPQLAKLEELAKAWVTARDLADRGDFTLARQTLENSRQKLGFLTIDMEQFHQNIALRQERFAQSFAELAKAVGENRLQDAIKWADDALVAAPSHKAARQYRDDVWEKLKPLTASYAPSSAGGQASPDSVISLVGGAAFASLGTTAPHNASITSKSKPTPQPQSSMQSVAGLPKRYYLWVDGGGGYLVCTGSHITIGQAGADAPIDIPIYADLARVHATITRDSEGYILESSRGASVNGKPITRETLKPGDRITLGSNCQLVFDLPSPLSPTARLDLVSGHRFQTAVDAILLMAESLTLGPGDESHVPMDGDKMVSLYRSQDGLSVKCAGQFRVDTFQFQERANLRLPANIVGHAHSFTFHLEPAGRN